MKIDFALKYLMQTGNVPGRSCDRFLAHPGALKYTYFYSFYRASDNALDTDLNIFKHILVTVEFQPTGHLTDEFVDIRQICNE